MKEEDIANLDMRAADKAARDYFAEEFAKLLFEPSPLVKLVLANMPPDTRTPLQKARDRMKRKVEDFRIWLSKKIYDWSGYEDQL